MVSATVIDVEALWQTIWTAAVAGVLVCVVFAIAVLGATRSSDARREHNATGSAAYAALALLCTAATLAMATYGIVLIAN
jgi:hypothetical protein